MKRYGLHNAQYSHHFHVNPNRTENRINVPCFTDRTFIETRTSTDFCLNPDKSRSPGINIWLLLFSLNSHLCGLRRLPYAQMMQSGEPFVQQPCFHWPTRSVKLKFKKDCYLYSYNITCIPFYDSSTYSPRIPTSIGPNFHGSETHYLTFYTASI